jgi:hypothetical protein
MAFFFFCYRYTNDHHNDFVRGLAWHSRKGTLYSCGWDKQVVAHKLLVSPNRMEVNGIIEEKDGEEQKLE